MIMHFLGRFYTPAVSKHSIYGSCLRELLCLAGSFHSLHIITYLDNTANTPFFMSCPFSSVVLKQTQVSPDMVLPCSVITSQQDVAVCLLCRLLAQFLMDQGPQLSQILTGNNKPELFWKEHKDGQASSFSHIISELTLRLEPGAPHGLHAEYCLTFRLKLIKSLMNPDSLDSAGKGPNIHFYPSCNGSKVIGGRFSLNLQSLHKIQPLAPRKF